ncbi:MAG TPA: hypothetical protein VIM77_12770 [Mucilaginibacter sp.]
MPVKQELEYLENYIALQKVRASSKLRLQVDFEEELADEPIHPLLLLPLVENAFKYIGGDYKISISARSRDNRLVFSVVNDIPAQMPVNGNYSGIGLDNLRRRLLLLYPGRHNLVTMREETRFVANLELDFKS